MRTEHLIRALAADAVRPVNRLRQGLVGGLLVGTAISVAVFCMAIHLRHDIATAWHSPPFVLKVIVMLCLVGPASALVMEYTSPTPPRRGLSALAVAPSVLAVALVVELFSKAPRTWGALLIGHNAVHCLTLVPLLSMAPAIGLFVVMKRGAPYNPMRAGAMVGLAAGAVGAVLYALSCPDDSPLFVATWYPIAIAMATTVCAATGRRLLRW